MGATLNKRVFTREFKLLLTLRSQSVIVALGQAAL